MTRPRQDWYPGLMERTRRFLGKHLPQIDLVLEIADARAPHTSRWPGLDAMLAGRRRLLVLNKADLADREETGRWLEHFGSAGVEALASALVSGSTGGVPGPALSAPKLRSAVQRLAAAGGPSPGRAFKVAVVGMPNVGKSSVLNAVAGRRRAATGAKPGLTRGRQWAVVSGRLWLLDLPGVLPPAPRDDDELCRLALIGALPEGKYDTQEAALFLLRALASRRGAARAVRVLAVDPLPSGAPSGRLLESFARRRGLLAPGGEPDLLRAAQALLVVYRRGGLGPLTLEEAPGGG